jgi:hypothetical protein
MFNLINKKGEIEVNNSAGTSAFYTFKLIK